MWDRYNAIHCGCAFLSEALSLAQRTGRGGTSLLLFRVSCQTSVASDVAAPEPSSPSSAQVAVNLSSSNSVGRLCVNRHEVDRQRDKERCSQKSRIATVVAGRPHAFPYHSAPITMRLRIPSPPDRKCHGRPLVFPRIGGEQWLHVVLTGSELGSRAPGDRGPRLQRSTFSLDPADEREMLSRSQGRSRTCVIDVRRGLCLFLRLPTVA